MAVNANAGPNLSSPAMKRSLHAICGEDDRSRGVPRRGRDDGFVHDAERETITEHFVQD